jgi:2-methylcitrate synthase
MATDKTAGLAGVVAGDTAIATVGKEGKGLTYRGYSIYDLAEHSTFEEVAYLLIYGRLPTQAELNSYKETLCGLRRLPAPLKTVLEQIPGGIHPMDVMRTGCSMLGTLEPEDAARDQIAVANRLTACFSSMLLYWYHFQKSGKRIETATDDDSTAGHFLHLLHGREPDGLRRRAIDVSGPSAWRGQRSRHGADQALRHSQPSGERRSRTHRREETDHGFRPSRL